MFLSKYKTLVFDCDGVILNSNAIKTKAFYDVALSYGEKNASALVTYHIQNGGISRNIKFEYFIKNILGQKVTNYALNQLLEKYGQAVQKALLTCDVTSDLGTLRQKTCHVSWMLVSGGNQNELRHVFAARNIADLFDAGIYGSPDNKHEILSKVIKKNILCFPALYVGDSQYDHVAAKESGLDFIFVAGWTDFADYNEYCQKHSIRSIDKVADLMNMKEQTTNEEV